MCHALANSVAQAAAQPKVRVVVVTGAGNRAFIGGADINEMAGLDQTTAKDFISNLHQACRAIRNAPVPVIARIQGYCLGAGLEIAASCDVRVAAQDAVFGMPEVRVGIPSVIEAALLPYLIGWGRTRYLLLTGDNISADVAFAWGLIEQLVAVDALDQAVDACVASIMASGRNAILLQKALINRWQELPLDAAIAAGIDAFADAFRADEPHELMAQFLNRPRA